MIIIRSDDPLPAAATALSRRLVALAGGDQSRIQTGYGGFVVDEALAAAYLNTTHNGHLPPAPAAPAPPGVAAAVAEAETRTGVRRTTRKATSPSQGEDRR